MEAKGPKGSYSYNNTRLLLRGVLERVLGKGFGEGFLEGGSLWV